MTSVDVRLCECGCGQPTKPYPYTDRRYGWVKGEPARHLRGHRDRSGPKGPYRTTPKPDAPKCDRSTLTGPVCRALDCRAPMHRGRGANDPVERKCRKGHRRHSGRGICDACRKRPHPPKLGPIEQPRMRPDEVLDEWVWLRGTVRWVDFHAKVRLSFSGWQNLFADAAKRGDPRAVKHPDDEPVRHWRAKDDTAEKRKEAS